MTDRTKLFTASVRQNPNFPAWMDVVRDKAPELPSFDPNNHSDGADDWKYKSGMLDGYKYLLSLLGVELDE